MAHNNYKTSDQYVTAVKGRGWFWQRVINSTLRMLKHLVMKGWPAQNRHWALVWFRWVHPQKGAETGKVFSSL